MIEGAINWSLIAFALLGLVTLFAAYKVVTSEIITHSALYLVLAFVGMAGIFLVLNADFLAGVQILVYVGAITVMLIFAIMLSDIGELKLVDKRLKTSWLVRGLIPLLIAGGFTLVMFYVYSQVTWPVFEHPALPNSTALIGKEMFSTYVIPFELASVLLLVAMIGAIILTIKEER